METTQPQAPPPDKPSPARMYDYFLGGYHNFAIDRAAAEQVIALYPDAPRVTQANRAFLRRAVHFMLDRGIDQFLDLGSGIPTIGNVHGRRCTTSGPTSWAGRRTCSPRTSSTGRSCRTRSPSRCPAAS